MKTCLPSIDRSQRPALVLHILCLVFSLTSASLFAAVIPVWTANFFHTTGPIRGDYADGLPLVPLTISIFFNTTVVIRILLQYPSPSSSSQSHRHPSSKQPSSQPSSSELSKSSSGSKSNYSSSSNYSSDPKTSLPRSTSSPRSNTSHPSSSPPSILSFSHPKLPVLISTSLLFLLGSSLAIAGTGSLFRAWRNPIPTTTTSSSSSSSSSTSTSTSSTTPSTNTRTVIICNRINLFTRPCEPTLYFIGELQIAAVVAGGLVWLTLLAVFIVSCREHQAWKKREARRRRRAESRRRAAKKQDRNKHTRNDHTRHDLYDKELELELEPNLKPSPSNLPRHIHPHIHPDSNSNPNPDWYSYLHRDVQKQLDPNPDPDLDLNKAKKVTVESNGLKPTGRQPPSAPSAMPRFLPPHPRPPRPLRPPRRHGTIDRESEKSRSIVNSNSNDANSNDGTLIPPSLRIAHVHPPQSR